MPSTTSIGNISATEISYLDGATGNLQVQINNLIAGTGTFQPLDADLTAIAALAKTDNNVIVGNGTTWVAESGATARTSLGVAIGTDVQAYSSFLTTIAGLSRTDGNFIVGNGTTWVTESGNTVLNSIGVTATTAELNFVSGATSNIQAQLTALGSGSYQPLDSDLTAIAALSPTDSNFIVGNGTSWVAETGSTARTSLGLAIGTNVQAYSARLTDIAALTATNNYFMVGTGTTWAAETPANALLSLGVTAEAAELSFCDGLTGNIQTQIDNLIVGGGSFQPLDADLTAIAALTPVDSTFIVGSATGWVLENAATALLSLGVTATSAELNKIDGFTGTTTELNQLVGVNSAIQTQINGKQPLDSDLTAIAALAVTDSNFIVGNGTTWVAESGATARTSLGLGSLATASTINNANWSGTALSVANGGTGSTTAGAALTALGGQASSAALTAIAALSSADSNFIVGNGTTWVAEGAATALVSLGVTSSAAELNKLDGVTATTAELNHIVGVNSAIQTQLNNKQALDSDLTAIAALTPTDSYFIVGNGTTWVAETGGTARTSIGLGAVENTALSTWAGSANITTVGTIATGTWSGTAVAVTKGGTGSTSATDARTALGLAIGTNVQAYDADLTTIAGLSPTNGNAIVGNGSAWTSSNLQNAAVPNYIYQTTNGTASANTAYLLASGVTLTLPASVSGWVRVAGRTGGSGMLINPNGNYLNDSTSNLSVPANKGMMIQAIDIGIAEYRWFITLGEPG